jgi:hypothetical protein
LTCLILSGLRDNSIGSATAVLYKVIGAERRVQLTDTDDVELEPALHELLLDLVGDAVETNIAFGVDRLLVEGGRHYGRGEARCREL